MKVAHDHKIWQPRPKARQRAGPQGGRAVGGQDHRLSAWPCTARPSRTASRTRGRAGWAIAWPARCCTPTGAAGPAAGQGADRPLLRRLRLRQTLLPGSVPDDGAQAASPGVDPSLPGRHPRNLHRAAAAEPPPRLWPGAGGAGGTGSGVAAGRSAAAASHTLRPAPAAAGPGPQQLAGHAVRVGAAGRVPDGQPPHRGKARRRRGPATASS